MKKIFLIVLFLVFIPAFVLASYSSCNEFCRNDLNQCKRNCRMLWQDNNVGLNSCVDNCMDDYDKCTGKCN